jgi:hypothetical protein
MTEYEAAQLSISEVMRVQGLMGIGQTQSELIQNETVQYNTLVFGYLLIAYFIGDKLTRVQVTILNIFYMATVSSSLFQLFFAGAAGISLGKTMMALLPEGTQGNPTATIEFLALGTSVAAGIVITSLYFMWSVRHPKTE